jgi:hypothetical protein
MAEVERAARAANAHRFIERFPDGYATVVRAWPSSPVTYLPLLWVRASYASDNETGAGA